MNGKLLQEAPDIEKIIKSRFDEADSDRKQLLKKHEQWFLYWEYDSF